MSERTPLIAGGSHYNGGNHNHHREGSLAKLRAVFTGRPSYLSSFRWIVFGSWWNVLLVFIPLSFVAHHLNWDAALRFGFSFFAIMPLAKLLGEATDQLSIELGETLGALLNASFGNAVEIIVGIAALLQGQLRIVQTSMLGSILSNILLVLGCAFWAGGWNYHEETFQATGAQAASSLMTLSCITLIIPAAYHASFSDSKKVGTNNEDPKEGLLLISRGTAIILLLLYIAYLNFQLRTHPDLFRHRPSPEEEAEEEEEEKKMNLPAAAFALLVITLITSFCADYLVASIEETAERYNIPEAFIGLILLPIVANAAEHFTAVWMSLKGKMELTMGIAVGSSIQISTFVIPLLVIIGWITNHDLTLFFANFETITLFVSVFLVNMLIQDGKSNYMEGLMLIGLYLVIALAYWAS